MQSLKPAGLPPDSRRISPMKLTSSMGVEKTEWLDGEMQSFPMGTPRASAIYLGSGQHAAMAGFDALAQFELDHLDLTGCRGLGELVGVEFAVGGTAAEIAGTDLPNDV